MAGVKIMGVVGAGQMGAGIAQLAASARIPVVMADLDASALTRGMKEISSSLSRFVKKGIISKEQAAETLSRVSTTTSLADMSSADFVIEAAPEKESLKKSIFTELDRLLKPSAIIASNTSSISITRLAAVTNRPQQVIGMHFMNPPPIMNLVEIIRGLATSDEVFEITKELATERLSKTVTCSKDYPGFIVNRILMPMINEAFYALLEGVSTPHEIDTAMKIGTNQPMGPFTLADFIGLDTCLSIMNVLHRDLGDSKYRPCPLLVRYVDAGWNGRKSGRGVFEYRQVIEDKQQTTKL